MRHPYTVVTDYMSPGVQSENVSSPHVLVNFPLPVTRVIEINGTTFYTYDDEISMTPQNPLLAKYNDIIGQVPQELDQVLTLQDLTSSKETWFLELDKNILEQDLKDLVWEVTLEVYCTVKEAKSISDEEEGWKTVNHNLQPMVKVV